MLDPDIRSRTRPIARPRRLWAAWTLSFLAFPVAGLAGLAAAGGRIDSLPAAIAGGVVTGLLVGAGQALASRAGGGVHVPPGGWILASGAGTGLGLAVGTAAVGYRTGLGDLAVQGLLTGVVLGAAQALALPVGARRASRATWSAAVAALWALGWSVTTLAGVDVDRQYTVFGATGALTFSALSGLLLTHLLSAAGKDAP